MNLKKQKNSRGNDNMAIRQFEWKDIGKIMDIEQQSFGSDKWDELEFMKWYEKFPGGFLVVEEKDGNISAYAICDKEGYLRSIAVREGNRRNGIGKTLIREIIEKINLQELYLHVRISNEGAIKFYESLGFKRIQVFKGVYDDGEDAIYMNWKQGKNESN